MSRTPRVDPVDEADLCAAVRDARARGIPLNDAQAVHAARCPVCSVEPPGRVAGGADALFAGLEAQVRRETGLWARLRSLPTEQRLAGVAVVFAGALVVAPLSRHAGHPPMPILRVAIAVMLLSVGLAAVVRLLLKPLQSPPPSEQSVTVALLLGLALPLASAAASFIGGGNHVVGSDLRCFVFGGVLGGAFVLLLRAVDRGDLLTKTTGIVAAAAGGLAANAVLELHCPSKDPAHLVLGHASVGVALLALLWARRRLIPT